MSVSREVRALTQLTAIAFVAVACGTSIPPTPTPAATVSATPSSAPTATPGSSPKATPIPGLDLCALAPGAPTPATGIAVDPSLLAIVPAEVEGLALRPCPATAAEIAAEPGLATDVVAVAVALAVSTNDYVVATVVRPRPAKIDSGWFRDWRDTFDAGVCEAAGGVDLGRSEFEVDGRTVHRSTCAGGVSMYHVHLEDRGLILSIHGAGPLDLGRAIVAALEE